jgi:ABC-type glucose/galactose transport system permease subunit
MAWSTPLTAVSNSTLTAAQWNASVRDNFLETAPAKATTAGRLIVTTGANSIAERQVGTASVLTSETTASTSPTNLATVGPTLTMTTGSRVIVILGSYMSNSTVSGTNSMFLEVSGATTVAATDPALAVHFRSSSAAGEAQLSYAFPLDLTAGSNTFTAKYAVNLGTGTFSRRRIIILPFG